MATENTKTKDELEAELEELRVYATELGIEFRDNIGAAKLEEKIAKREQEIADAKKAEKEVLKESIQAEKSKKVKIIVEPRNRDAGINDQFFGFNSMATGLKESILVPFGEEVSVTEAMCEHIMSITYSEPKFKMVTGEDGMPKKEWYNKKQTRFIVQKV